jgi:hypothetical protein
MNVLCYSIIAVIKNRHFSNAISREKTKETSVLCIWEAVEK